MKRVYSFLMGACFLAAAVFIPGIGHAGLDSPGSMSGGDSSDDVQIVYAVFGGEDAGVITCTNVTDRVSKLLLNAPKGFFAHAEDLGIDSQAEVFESLIILYNYDGHRHFFVRRHSGPKINLGLLKEAAKIDDAQGAPVPTMPAIAADLDPEVHILFAAYGVHEAYWDVTEKVVKLLKDSPKGFTDSNDVMGGDPEWDTSKILLVIFESKGQRHFFTAEANESISIDSGALVAKEPDKKTVRSPSKSDTAIPYEGPAKAPSPFGN